MVEKQKPLMLLVLLQKQFTAKIDNYLYRCMHLWNSEKKSSYF